MGETGPALYFWYPRPTWGQHVSGIRSKGIGEFGLEGGGCIYTYSAGCQAPRWIRELNLGVRFVSLGENGSTLAGTSLLEEAFTDMGCGYLGAGIGIPEGMAHGHPPTALRRCRRQQARSEASVA